MDKIGQYGLNWTIDKIRQNGQKSDKMDKIGQNWTKWTKLDNRQNGQN